MKKLVPWPIKFTAAVAAITLLGFLGSLSESVPAPRFPSEAKFSRFEEWAKAYLQPGQRTEAFILSPSGRNDRIACINFTSNQDEGRGMAQEIREHFTDGRVGGWKRHSARVLIRPGSNLRSIEVRYRNTADRGAWVFVNDRRNSDERVCGRLAENDVFQKFRFPPVAHNYRYYFSGDLGSPDTSARKVTSRDIEERRVTIIKGGDQSRPYKVEPGRNVLRCLVWNASLPRDQLHRLPLMRSVLNGRWNRVSSEQIRRAAASEAERVVYRTYYFSFDNQTTDQVVVEVGTVPIPPNNDSSACGYNPQLLGRPRYEESMFVSGVWRRKD